jgi:hypothetical protein
MKMKEARAAGYCAMTAAYHLPAEQWMLDAVVNDMRRGKVDHVLVRVWNGVEVWRRASARQLRVEELRVESSIARKREVNAGEKARPHPVPLPQERVRGTRSVCLQVTDL